MNFLEMIVVLEVLFTFILISETFSYDFHSSFLCLLFVVTHLSYGFVLVTYIMSFSDSSCARLLIG